MDQDGILEGILGAGAGWARMARAAAEDMAGALNPLGNGDEPADWLDAWDPDYIRKTLPTLRLFSNVYHRAEVRDLRNIPAEGPVLLVGNHSGGTLISDTFVFAQAFYYHFGPLRRFHQLAHDLVFQVPGVRATLSRYGTVPASPENMRRVLERDAALLVYPGGDHETYRPSWESAEIDFAGRTGFVKLAIEHDTPIVPVVAIGGQETALFLGQGRQIAKLLRLNSLFRLKVFPAQVGPPFGLTVLDLPGRIPLPAKITVRALPKIDLKKRLGANPDVDEAYELVTGTMQRALHKLDDERSLPVIG
ncbi:MAG TPA: lysophospholipid acyltransferase family protein [Thermoleophilaceae bacterium]|nr:lysophospholipid acyltransferase family protein [Thermoleophilaceae bacterium]